MLAGRLSKERSLTNGSHGGLILVLSAMNHLGVGGSRSHLVSHKIVTRCVVCNIFYIRLFDLSVYTIGVHRTVFKAPFGPARQKLLNR